jgi:cobalamin transport system substrate-binding protein
MITGRLGNGLLLVARDGTYTGDAIQRAGARLGSESRGAIAQISPEAILSADPDILLFAGSERDMNELLGRPGWLDLGAVRSRRVHAVSRSELLISGPRTVDGIERLARVFHPNAAWP